MHEVMDNEVVRYGITALIGVLSAYFTTTGTIKTKLTQIEEREANHYAEMRGLLEDVRDELRELRRVAR